MYNSRRLSRSTRTLQRRKVDTGIAIDPSKVNAYMEYLLNNGYVQLPQPIPPADGSYLFLSHPDLNVIDLISPPSDSELIIYAEDLIPAVLSSQNISLNGSETVYMELKISLKPGDSDIVADIYNTTTYGPKFKTRYSFDSINEGAVNFVIAFIYCNGRYAITFRRTPSTDFTDLTITKPPSVINSTIPTFIYFTLPNLESMSIKEATVTLLTVGRSAE